MSLDELGEFLKSACEEAEKIAATLPNPIASIYVSRDGNSLEVLLDNSRNVYSEWIPGEGGDIGLTRIRETNRLNGAHLPFYAKTLFVDGSHFEGIQVDIESGRVTGPAIDAGNSLLIEAMDLLQIVAREGGTGPHHSPVAFAELAERIEHHLGLTQERSL